jgi:glucose/arabinose dehydrogenase
MRVVGQTSLFTELEKRIPDVRVHPAGSIYILTDSENENGKVLCITPIKNG